VPQCPIAGDADEIHHIAKLAKVNILKLNRQKSVQIVFTDSVSRSLFKPVLGDISRVMSVTGSTRSDY